MRYAVIDTNVLLVANRSHEGVSDECLKSCVDRLLLQQASGITVIDEQFHLLTEYKNKTYPNQPKGVGDVFLKWLLRNIANPAHVDTVSVTQTEADCFKEFPDDALSDKFDPPDRKFVAVANAHPKKPPVLQAADCKWLDWWPDLTKHGISVEFLCPDDVCSFYAKKFPNSSPPKLPQ